MTITTLPTTRGAPDRRPSPLELATLRAMLEQQREFRLDQLVQLALPSRTGPLSSSFPEVSRSLITGARAALHDVQAALWRIEDETYGTCTGCARPVELHRLEILPHVARCLPCERAVTAAATG